jgi:predicted TIM-barrel fold metal-dependent hydrolase
MRIDTQVHVVSRDHERYPLDPPDMDVPRWFEHHPRTADEVLAEMDAAGVDRAVLVQGFSAYQYDNRYTADAAAARPDRFASACIVDVHADPVRMIRHWVSDRGARAIRLFLQLGDDGWLDGPDCDAVFDTLEELGAIAQAAVVADQLAGVARAAARHPGLTVLVDHCGFPDFSGGPSYPNARHLFMLAAVPNVHLKLSAHVFQLAETAGTTARAVTDGIVEAFGAARVMWASDFTVYDRPYAEWLRQAELACAGLTASDRDLVLGEAAAAVWWR